MFGLFEAERRGSEKMHLLAFLRTIHNLITS